MAQLIDFQAAARAKQAPALRFPEIVIKPTSQRRMKKADRAAAVRLAAKSRI